MIRYALICTACDHDHESWFASSDAYDTLKAKQALTCPACGANDVHKAIMAPSVAGTRKTSDHADLETVARKARAHISKNFDHVGSNFASEARAMYFGETPSRPIWGQTTSEERASLEEDGVPAAPLPDILVPPVPKSDEDLN
ncbi:MAG: DUF1178 family protein [Pseudomonadota bacterium]